MENAELRTEARPNRLRQLAWLVGIWAAGVGGLGVVAMFIRLMMEAAGMRSH
ncbi:DUF2474 domain-containing protein [Cupriavidus pampae]|uniref:DUF2474 domain-containing protein n=1 Tax=Cupriavidus pampae TaxID=659251 RepID=A0ABN7XYY1_9BURK|nr:DUF2474 domain-containing protein [Cupriavidus pampae]CAG9166308.1 hypothetical protein LMG32289_00978 [Cupriavidus pampae]